MTLPAIPTLPTISHLPQVVDGNTQNWYNQQVITYLAALQNELQMIQTKITEIEKTFGPELDCPNCGQGFRALSPDYICSSCRRSG